MLRSLDMHRTATTPPSSKRRKTRDTRSDLRVPLLSLDEQPDGPDPPSMPQPPLDKSRAPQQSPILRRQPRIELMRQDSERWHDEIVPGHREPDRQAMEARPRVSWQAHWPIDRGDHNRTNPGGGNGTS